MKILNIILIIAVLVLTLILLLKPITYKPIEIPTLDDYEYQRDSLNSIILNYEFKLDSLTDIKRQILIKYEKEYMYYDTVCIDSVTRYISEAISNR